MLQSLKLAGALLCGFAFTAVAQPAGQPATPAGDTGAAAPQSPAPAGDTGAATTKPVKKHAKKHAMTKKEKKEKKHKKAKEEKMEQKSETPAAPSSAPNTPAAPTGNPAGAQ